ncbi:MAG: hypothetical protein JWM33_3399, partial [Caulobacteraceae bacterium]|nr:hypothetical protein [Caulobacteraceae bacterium]
PSRFSVAPPEWTDIASPCHVPGMHAHVLNLENQQDAIDAVRDILLLYVDMAQSYSGFGHASDANVRFDPLKYVDAELDNPPGCSPLVDMDFLRSGSAVLILCRLYDEWCEHEDVHASHYKEAIEDRRLRFTPDVEAVAREALRRGQMSPEDPWFDEAVGPIYQHYAVEYFERLSRMHRRAGGDGFLAREPMGA